MRRRARGPNHDGKIEAVIGEFIRQQNWQDSIDDLILRTHNYLKAGENGTATQSDGATQPGSPANVESGKITIHTDGACIGNPGPGGWCAIVTADGQQERIVRGGHWETTNNRMEMQAVISGLRTAGPNSDIEIWSDSQYVCKAFNDGWLARWKRNGWRTQSGAVLNQDLWVEMVDLVEGDHNRTVTFRWVKGHAGHKMNERADQVAREEAQQAGRNRSPAPRRRSRR